MKENKYIVDTTLRDGEQSPGIAFTVEEKVKIACMLDEIGICQIEAGIPAMGKFEKDAIYKIMEKRKNTKISSWNRMNIDDIRHSFDCSPDIIHICVPVSYVQIYSKLKKNKAWLLNTLIECVSFAREKDYEVAVGFEDASRADITFMITIINTLKEMGVTCVRYADTVGVLTPSKTADAIKALKRDNEIDIEIHVHNDLGMAVANSLEATKNGAKYIDCTLFGLGERSGNCNLADFLHIAQRIYNFNIDLQKVYNMQDEIKNIIWR